GRAPEIRGAATGISRAPEFRRKFAAGNFGRAANAARIPARGIPARVHIRDVTGITHGADDGRRIPVANVRRATIVSPDSCVWDRRFRGAARGLWVMREGPGWHGLGNGRRT